MTYRIKSFHMGWHPFKKWYLAEKLKPLYRAKKLKPTTVSEAYWPLFEEQIDESYDCSEYWNYLVRESEVYAY